MGTNLRVARCGARKNLLKQEIARKINNVNGIVREVGIS
jgi:hypothetical protein